MIKDLQLKNVSVKDQITCLAWFSFVLRCISVSGASREETFSFMQNVFKKTVKIINEGKSIPKPEDVGSDENTISHRLLSDSKSLSSKSLTGSESSKRKKRKSSNMSQKSTKTPSVTSSKSRKTVTKSFSETSTFLISPEEKVNMNLDTFYMFIKMIYQVFADRFVYSVVSGVYSSPVIVTPVDMHMDFHNPKPPKPEPVSPPPEKNMSLKKQKASTAKSSKKEGGSKKKESKKPRSSSKVSGPEGPSSGTDKRKQKKSKGNKEIKIGDDKLTKDKGEQKSKTKKIKDETKELPEGKKTGKGKKFSRKSRKSSSLHDEQDIQRILLEARIKQFDRVGSPERELEIEKLNTKDKYILPLADAVSDNFVENLIQRLIPSEEIPVEERKPTNGKGKKKSIAKEGKKKQKNKK
ncbi:mediator of RNA polymerase II transcription subunit 12-like [Homalodisca vitripennis]|uniref:mediator of RNA polymerase II transcription subunit 12-like n=1 Tax=Homalodisca vitripennis TaxID=197043 RepID=UPI001EEA8A47|nr:mediator of RNA polymerase II transcription subunit 12-like [Homalodisca vitripennis]KAG8256548.1 hypothetical protein J6590_065812 [Homalodisca vitripennis]